MRLAVFSLSLAKCCGIGICLLVLSACSDASSHFRIWAEEGDVSHLVEALDHSDINTRLEAISYLGETGHRDAVDPLVEELNATNAVIRKRAAHALGLLAKCDVVNENAISKMISLFKDRSYDSRPALAVALGKTKSSLVIPVLLTSLSEDNENVRIAVVVGLMSLCEPPSAIGEEQVLSISNTLVRVYNATTSSELQRHIGIALRRCAAEKVRNKSLPEGVITP